MNVAGRARIVAYFAALVIAGASMLAANGPGHAPEAWRAALQRVDVASAGGHAREARRAWEDAYRAAVGARTPEGVLAVGWASLRIGEVTGNRRSAVAEARRLFLIALFQARERQDPVGVAVAAEAFATLGDREVADRAFAVATALPRNRDARTSARIAAPADSGAPP